MRGLKVGGILAATMVLSFATPSYSGPYLDQDVLVDDPVGFAIDNGVVPELPAVSGMATRTSYHGFATGEKITGESTGGLHASPSPTLPSSQTVETSVTLNTVNDLGLLRRADPLVNLNAWGVVLTNDIVLA